MQGDRIASVTIQHIETGGQTELTAPFFSDCTGDATIGYLAGADWAMGREGRDEYGESLAPEQPDSLVMGASIQWYSKDMKKKTSFPLAHGYRLTVFSVKAHAIFKMRE